MCNGTVTLTVDNALNPAIVGTYSCDWPVLDIWAALWLDEVTGTITGNENGGLLIGNIDGDESIGTLSFSLSWNGFMSAGPAINGTYSDFTILTEDYVGWWSATRIGP
jgi:hypothetical protein